MPPILLLTRPKAQSDQFAEIVADRFGDAVNIVKSPILEISYLPVTTPVSTDNVLIFSSVNAVHAIAAAQPAAAQRAYCVGDRTAETARAAGFDAISAAGDAEAVIAQIVSDAPTRPLLYLHGDVVRKDIAAELRAKRFDAAAQVVYTQAPKGLTAAAQAALEGDTAVILPLFSPRSATLVAAAANRAPAPITVAALSPSVAAAWTGPAKRVEIAGHPDAAHMLDTIATILRDALS